MLARLTIDFSRFTFIDIGSGKGRALLLATEYSFRRIIGVELLSELNSVAEKNVREIAGRTGSANIELICQDAAQFEFPPEPSVIFLFNPLRESALRRLIGNLEKSLDQNPRSLYVMYANPLWEAVLAGSSRLRKFCGNAQYSLFMTFGD